MNEKTARKLKMQYESDLSMCNDDREKVTLNNQLATIIKWLIHDAEHQIENDPIYDNYRHAA